MTLGTSISNPSYRNRTELPYMRKKGQAVFHEIQGRAFAGLGGRKREVKREEKKERGMCSEISCNVQFICMCNVTNLKCIHNKSNMHKPIKPQRNPNHKGTNLHDQPMHGLFTLQQQ